MFRPHTLAILLVSATLALTPHALADGDLCKEGEPVCVSESRVGDPHCETEEYGWGANVVRIEAGPANAWFEGSRECATDGGSRFAVSSLAFGAYDTDGDRGNNVGGASFSWFDIAASGEGSAEEPQPWSGGTRDIGLRAWLDNRLLLGSERATFFMILWESGHFDGEWSGEWCTVHVWALTPFVDNFLFADCVSIPPSPPGVEWGSLLP